MMTIDIKERNLWDLLPVLLAGTLTLILLTGCGTASSQAPAAPPALVTLTVVSTVVATAAVSPSPPTATSVSTASATPLPPTFDPEPTIYFPPPTALAATKIAFETQVAENDRVRETAIALTPPPTEDPFTATPEPTPIWRDGSHGCGSWYSTDRPHYTSCWGLTYNGNHMLVLAGNEGREGDIHQGVLVIQIYNVQRMLLDEQHYYTLSVVGGVQIMPFSGMIVPLMPADHTLPDRFFFDLVTRQWVTPAGTPLPTPQSSPVVLP